MIGFGQTSGSLLDLLLKPFLVAPDLRLGLSAPGNVTRRSKYADDLASLLAIDTRVVQNVHECARRAAQRQRIVGDKPGRENLLIAFACSFIVGEVVGEIGADERMPWKLGGQFRRFVNVGYLALRADGDERVKARFKQ